MVERTIVSGEGGMNDMLNGLISNALGGQGQRPTKPEKITIITASYESGQVQQSVPRVLVKRFINAFFPLNALLVS
jgi:hypothetical protein